MMKDMEDKLAIITEFNFRDYVYVPICACLLSKNPYALNMETILRYIVQGKENHEFNNSLINKIILHITTEVTVPPDDSSLLFSIPGKKQRLEVLGLNQSKLPQTNFNMVILLDYFDVQEILLLLKLLLLEQKVLIVADNYRLLPIICDALINALYPFSWTCAFIPVVTENLVKYLQTPMPFLMGIEEHLYQFVGEFIDEEEGIVVFNLAKKNIYLSNKTSMKSFLFFSNQFAVAFVARKF